jgi:hypothetical protein
MVYALVTRVTSSTPSRSTSQHSKTKNMPSLFRRSSSRVIMVRRMNVRCVVNIGHFQKWRRTAILSEKRNPSICGTLTRYFILVHDNVLLRCQPTSTLKWARIQLHNLSHLFRYRTRPIHSLLTTISDNGCLEVALTEDNAMQEGRMTMLD